MFEFLKILIRTGIFFSLALNTGDNVHVVVKSEQLPVILISFSPQW